jgi:hypothetical protein
LTVVTLRVYTRSVVTPEWELRVKNVPGPQEDVIGEHVMEHSYFHHQALMAEGRREALKWLARQLRWERRLGELRHDEPATPAQQAA